MALQPPQAGHVTGIHNGLRPTRSARSDAGSVDEAMATHGRRQAHGARPASMSPQRAFTRYHECARQGVELQLTPNREGGGGRWSSPWMAAAVVGDDRIWFG
jgi:hypothetical protein